MFCTNCGSQMPDNAAFCTNCGAKLNENVQPAEPVTEEATTGMPVQEQPLYQQPEPEQTGAYQQAEPYQQSYQQSYQQPYQQADYGQQTNAPIPPENAPKDYLAINIILTVASALICCCNCLSIAGLVTGIIGIVASSNVRKAVEAGNLPLAQAKSNTARTMWIVTAIILGVSAVVGILLLTAGAGMSADLMEDLVSQLDLH